MRKNWYDIKAAAGKKPATISIYDEIGMWGITAKDFIASFRSIEDNDITLEINTPGGSVFDGLAMFNAMKLSGKNITVKVMGIAASMGSYLAMVGAKIVMPENTFMMVHNPLNGLYGNADDHREMADVLDKIGASLTATYVARTGKSLEDIAALLANESYLTAAECLALGLCDEVTPAVTATACFEREDFPENIQALFAPAAPAPIVAFADQVTALAVEAGMPEYAATWAVACATLESVTCKVVDAREITALCTVAKHPTLAAGYITGSKTVAEARSALCDVLAANDKPIDTSLKISSDPLSGVQPTGLKPTDVWAARQKPKGAKQ